MSYLFLLHIALLSSTHFLRNIIIIVVDAVDGNDVTLYGTDEVLFARLKYVIRDREISKKRHGNVREDQSEGQFQNKRSIDDRQTMTHSLTS